MLDPTAVLHLLMWPAVIVVGFVMIGAVITAIFSGNEGGYKRPENPWWQQTEQKREPMFRRKSSIMNGSERAFFFELQKQMPQGYYIFPNMRIADILEAIDGRGFYKRRNEILPKHIDFLICDSYFKPVVALELNGSSHRRSDRIERDGRVREIFEDAGLPLEFIHVGTSFQQEISRVLALPVFKSTVSAK